MSPPPPPPVHRFPDEYVEEERYRNNRERSNEYPQDFYETETDYSPPHSPRMSRSPNEYQHSNYRYFSPSPLKTKSTNESKGSSSEKSNAHSSDDWDRRTF